MAWANYGSYLVWLIFSEIIYFLCSQAMWALSLSLFFLANAWFYNGFLRSIYWDLSYFGRNWLLLEITFLYLSFFFISGARWRYASCKWFLSSILSLVVFLQSTWDSAKNFFFLSNIEASILPLLHSIIYSLVIFSYIFPLRPINFGFLS